jgi:hypothetical protein
MPSVRGLVTVALLLVGSLSASVSRADDAMPDKMACIAADTKGQSLRLDAQLRDARARFEVCASPRCPGIVREDCVQRLADLDAAQPTVVFGATNGDGRTLRAVKVFMDGRLLTDRLDGRPLRVDPGEHHFVFTSLGRITSDMDLLLNEGDRARHGVVLRTDSAEKTVAADDLTSQPEPPGRTPAGGKARVASAIAVAPARAPEVASARAPETEIAAPSRHSVLDSEQGRLGLVAGGLGVAGVVVGSVFGLLTFAEWRQAHTDWAGGPPGCGAATCERAANEQVTASSDGNLSTFAFIAGGVSLVAGAVLLLTAPDPPPSSRAIRVVPTGGPSEGLITVQGSF